MRSLPLPYRTEWFQRAGQAAFLTESYRILNQPVLRSLTLNLRSSQKHVPFPFILDELESLRPTARSVFGFTHVYLEDKLLFSLRNAPTRTGSNGMWLYTTTEHVDSLAAEFADLPRRQIWRSGKKAWIVLATRLGNFEEHAFKACELVLRGDQRIGRVSRRVRGMDSTMLPLVTVRER